jgi:anti-sigma regulatory factor (Ser/Thr protein kinase)
MDGACTPDTIEVARLLVSELATNAVCHTGSDSIRVEVNVDAERTQIGVHDDQKTTAPLTPILVDPFAEHGRGLQFVEQMAERWWLDEDSESPGKTIWFELICT